MKWNHLIYIIFFAIIWILEVPLRAQLTSLDGGRAVDIAGWAQQMTSVPAKIGDGRWEIGSDLIDPNTSYLKLKPRADSSPARWWRVRSHFDPAASSPEKVEAEVKALAAIRAQGINSVVFVRWPSDSWKSGVRVGRVQGVPLDLREAFERGRGYGRVYGQVTAAFEIENEPDIDFVNENPETYLAFHKAMYLGVHRGAEEAAAAAKMEDESEAATAAKIEDGRSEIGEGAEAEVEGVKVEGQRSSEVGRTVPSAPRLVATPPEVKAYRLALTAPVASQPLVVMAPLALPPGPYFERLVENGLLSYTDAFNYHYYGYAEDFTGVYRQFEAAVTEASLGAASEKVGKWKSGKVGRTVPRAPDLNKGGTTKIEDRRSEIGSEVSENQRVGPDFRSGPGSTADAEAAMAAKMEDGRSEIGSDLIDPKTSHLKPITPATTLRRLPVLLTEYGYGSMLNDERYTVEGRVRQWKWFSTVVPQIRKLRIAGPMAFYLPPYFEAGTVEFGLTMKAVPSTAKIEDGRSKIGSEKNALSADSGNVQKWKSEKAGASEKVGRWEGGKVGPVATAPSHFAIFAPLTSASFSAGGLAFTPTDFGDSRARPWMERIGQEIGEKQASPALAWLLDYGEKHPYRSRDWTVEAPAPSPVVLDFIAGKNLNQLKRYGGYLVMNDAQGVPHVGGELVVYNFSSHPVSGRLEKVERWEGGKVGNDLRSEPGLAAINTAKIEDGRSEMGSDLVHPNTSHLKPKTSPPQVEITLAPNERRVIPISFPLANGSFRSHSVRWIFVPDEDKEPPSVFSTRFYPDASAMKETVVASFDQPLETSTKNRTLLLRRKLAHEEAFVVPQGRWLVTPGVSVREGQDTWHFTVRDEASRSYWSLRAELPLPDDWTFPDNGLLRFAYRLDALRTVEKNEQRYFEAYFRTANGNLYQVWPRQRAATEWRTYMEAKDNFTMAFYGRAALTWKFSENRPVALVFLFRPGVPHAVTYEVTGARIGVLEK